MRKKFYKIQERISYLLAKIPREVRYIIFWFAATRVVLTIIGVASRMLLDPYGINEQFRRVFSPVLWLDMWGQWDAGWYLDIARNGYSGELSDSSAALGQANYGFFPVFPMLIRIAARVTAGDYFTAGLLIANASLLIGAYFLYKLVSERYSRALAFRSVKYMFLFPTGFLLSGVLSEPVFLALAVASFYFASRRSWLVAGLLGMLTALTRSVGVLMVIPLIYEYLRQKDFKLSGIRPDSAALLLVPLGLLGYLSYTYALTGDPLAYVHIKQSGWGIVLSSPLRIFYEAFFSGSIINIFNVSFVVLVLALLTYYAKIIGAVYWLAAVLLISAPFFGGFAVVPGSLRFLLVAFPMFIVFAWMGRRPRQDQALSITFALLQGFLLVMWVNRIPILV